MPRHAAAAADHSALPASGSALGRVESAMDRYLGAVEQLTLVIACAALFFLMFLIFVDAVLRYVANSPLRFAPDLVTLYLISAAFLLILSYSLRHGSHINVDVFIRLLSNRLQRLLSGLAFLCASPVVGIMSIEMTRLSWESYAQGEALIGLYAMPLWPSKAIIAFSLIVLNLRLLHLGFFNFLSGFTGRKELAIRMPLSAEHPEEEMV